MAYEPDQNRRDIEATRADMAGSLEQIGDRVAPSKVVARSKQKASDKVEEVKERVSPVRVARRQGEKLKSGFRDFMGSDGSHGSADPAPGGGVPVTERASDVAARARDAATNAAGSLTDIPRAARRNAESKPLAAGLLSFATGFLMASVLPPTDAERQLTERVKESLRPVEEEAKERGKMVANELAQSARQNVEAVKQSATGAAQRVKSEVQDHAGDLRDEAQSAVEAVKGEAADAAQSVQRKAQTAVDEPTSAARDPQPSLGVRRRY
ncbi:MAG: DUF3618 domain-containing protein [Acidimicrobiales bacterium]